MHVLVLQAGGGSAAVIYQDGDNEVQQEPAGDLGNIWAAVGPGRPLHGTQGFGGAAGM